MANVGMLPIIFCVTVVFSEWGSEEVLQGLSDNTRVWLPGPSQTGGTHCSVSSTSVYEVLSPVSLTHHTSTHTIHLYTLHTTHLHIHTQYTSTHTTPLHILHLYTHYTSTHTTPLHIRTRTHLKGVARFLEVVSVGRVEL